MSINFREENFLFNLLYLILFSARIRISKPSGRASKISEVPASIGPGPRFVSTPKNFPNPERTLPSGHCSSILFCDLKKKIKTLLKSSFCWVISSEKDFHHNRIMKTFFLSELDSILLRENIIKASKIILTSKWHSRCWLWIKYQRFKINRCRTQAHTNCEMHYLRPTQQTFKQIHYLSRTINKFDYVKQFVLNAMANKILINRCFFLFRKHGKHFCQSSSN